METSPNPTRSKRLFFGMEVKAPWTVDLPSGRVLAEDSRHLTLAFLGSVSWVHMRRLLSEIPLPQFRIGPVGQTINCLFLPPGAPRIVAWQVAWLEWGEELRGFQITLQAWLHHHHLIEKRGDFLDHITVARSPFCVSDWAQSFKPIPVMLGNLHLYERVGPLTYRPVWTHPLRLAAEEVEHTADLAFSIRAESLSQLLVHAKIALSMRFRPLLTCAIVQMNPRDLDEVVCELNRMIAMADARYGCPLKAVSFSGGVDSERDGTLIWKMIVDV